MENILLLRKVPLFSSLRIAELRRFAHKIEVRPFSKGEVICEEGKPTCQNLYVVAEGQLNILLGDKVLAALSSPNYFGEVSLLSGEPHSATIKAASAGKLLVIKKELFDEIIKKHPEILFLLSQSLGRKLYQTAQFSHKPENNKHVYSILSAEAKTGKSTLAVNLAASYYQQTKKKTVIVDYCLLPASSAALLKIKSPLSVSPLLKKERKLGFADIQRCVVKHPAGLDLIAFYEGRENLRVDKERLIELCEALKAEYEMVIIDVPPGLTLSQINAFAEVCDGIIVLVRDNSFSLRKGQSFIDCLNNNFPDLGHKLRVGVFLEKHKFPQRLPVASGFTLPFGKEEVEFSVYKGEPLINAFPKSELSRSISRLAREIGNIRIGVALSAGMAAGLAHIGVLKVFERENIPVDMVSGASGGAVYGAPFAAGVPLSKVEEAAKKIGKLQMFFMLDFTIPYAGFIRGRRIVNFVKSFIGSLRFEHLSVPFKVIATDFYTGEVYVFEKGLILDALRASIAVPGLIAPYNYNGRFLVDGATVSPLPVDILYQGGADKVIAVNTCVDPVVSRKNKSLPHLFDVIAHSRAITSHRMAEIESQKADLVVYPDTSPFKWSDYHRAGEIIEAGEKAAEEALPRIRKLLV